MPSWEHLLILTYTHTHAPVDIWANFLCCGTLITAATTLCRKKGTSPHGMAQGLLMERVHAPEHNLFLSQSICCRSFSVKSNKWKIKKSRPLSAVLWLAVVSYASVCVGPGSYGQCMGSWKRTLGNIEARCLPYPPFAQSCSQLSVCMLQ